MEITVGMNMEKQRDMRKCDKCHKARREVHLTCAETLGKLYLCEKCHDKLDKPFKNKRYI